MFEPYIGDLYGKPSNIFGGRRVLAVGESHYSSEHEIGSVVPDMTKHVMAKYADGIAGGWRRTFDNFAWAMSGKRRSDLEVDSVRGEFGVYRSVAFYNYVPVVLTDDARSGAPSPDQMAMGRLPFDKVLDELKPELVVVWGYRLFPWIIKNHFPEYPDHPFWFKGDWIDVRSSRDFRAVRMLHPSAAYSSKQWAEVIRRALNE